MWQRTSVALLAMFVGCVGIVPGARAGMPAPSQQGGYRSDVDGDMRTGHRHANACHRWRRVVDRLGETYAGTRLRQTVVARACAFADHGPRDEQVWTWPWSHADVDGALPPRLHGKFGAWTIRCDSSGRRERCALIHEAEANILPGNGATEKARVVTHFVIDEISGAERLLWRVFVERAEPSWFAANPDPAAASPALDLVRAHAGAVMLRKAFDTCGRFGCQMEADVAIGGRMAARLWDGGSLQIDVRPAPGLSLTKTIPATGFRQGLAELSMLKRREQGIVAAE